MGSEAVRESSLLEEIETLEVDQYIKDRMISKYWEMIERQRADMEGLRAEKDKELKKITESDIEKDTIIHVLANHVRVKELL